MGLRSTVCVAAFGAMVALSGCVVAPDQAGINPYPAPPPPRAESIPPPPPAAQAQIWQPGHWDWTGTSYAWSEGQWVPREGHGANWLDGFWSYTPSGWSWIPGHWV